MLQKYSRMHNYQRRMRTGSILNATRGVRVVFHFIHYKYLGVLFLSMSMYYLRNELDIIRFTCNIFPKSTK